MLGGSRARGEHSPTSDFDLGIYYRRPLDLGALRELAREVGGPSASITNPGDWGPWVDGGGWLTLSEVPVDWIYRDWGRVEQAWRDAQAGRFYFHGQVGHPFGVPDFAYAGEVALGVVLSDPSGALADLKERAATYPPKLAEAVTARLDEAAWMIQVARKAVSRADTMYIGGCLFTVVGLCCHALHAHAGRWLIGEKGAVASAARIPGSPAGFAEKAHGVLAALGATPGSLESSLGEAESLIRETATACAHELQRWT